MHRRQITDKYVFTDSNNKDDLMSENNQKIDRTITATEIKIKVD